MASKKAPATKKAAVKAVATHPKASASKGAAKTPAKNAEKIVADAEVAEVIEDTPQRAELNVPANSGDPTFAGPAGPTAQRPDIMLPDKMGDVTYPDIGHAYEAQVVAVTNEATGETRTFDKVHTSTAERERFRTGE